MKQKIIVTALPNGIATRGGASIWKVSAAFGLQVEDADTVLQNVPDMLRWADLVKNAKFIVQVNGTELEARVVSKPVDIALWKNLFSPTVKVKSFVQKDMAQKPIASYPVKHVLGFIKFVVEATGKNFSTDLPSATDYTENPLMHLISDYKNPQFPQRGTDEITMSKLAERKPAGGKIRDQLNTRKFIPFNETSSPEEDFAQLKNFHGLYNQNTNTPFVQTPPPDFEFHKILSALSTYPQLLRRLGLVVDLEFKGPTGLLAGTPNIRIIPSAINFATSTTFVCPATAYTKTDFGFYARPLAGSKIDRGHLKINGDGFTVFQVDTDGTALKLCQQMDALLLKKAKHIFYAVGGKVPNAAGIPFYNNEAPRKEGLPSNRTAGIAVARNGRAAQIHENFKRMNDWKTKLMTGAAAPAGVSGTNAKWILTTEILYADDVNMGYRMDIQPEGSTWFSLHKRNNKFSYLNTSGTNIDIPGIETDEGFIQTSASEEKTGPATTQLKIGEAIARWEGWSLSVPRPGSSLNDPKTPRETNESYKEVYDKSIAGNAAKEHAKYKTPVVADFKLNVIPSIEKGSLPMLRFGKKYSIKIRTVDMAGNSVALDFKPEDPDSAIVKKIRYMRYEPADAPFLVLGTEIKDGESSEVMVIRSNEGMTVEQYENANIDSKHTVPFKAEAIRHVKPPRTTVETATLHSMLDKGFGTASSAEAAAIYQKIITDKDPLITDADATYKLKLIDGTQKTITVEYLADPMAAGVTFFISANDPNPKIPNPEIFTRRVSFYFDPEVKTDAEANTTADYSTWMNPQTFRITLKEGNPDIQWQPSSRTLVVTLQKGVIVKLNYACFWRPDDIVKHSGILDMMGMNNLAGAVGQRIATGQHWMFSPWREITFVHAVQQPISKIGTQQYPHIAHIKPDRDFGENFARLNSKFLVHGPSTDKLDIEADWIEWVDDGVSIETTPNEWNDDVNRSSVKSNVFHFSALYPVFEYVFDDLPQNSILKAIQHKFNDTKHRKVNYKTIASTRYRENFFQLVEDKKEAFKLTRESATVKEIIIPSSARPLAPQIEYVIPNFEWERGKTGNKTVTGRGSGLRIYLKRPWYSSGEGEQLAVVLQKAAEVGVMLSNPSTALSHLFTTWGTDPTKLSAPLPGVVIPGQEVFVSVKPENKVNGLSIEEIPGIKMNIVAYDVKYDKERQLYYVDIMMNFMAAYYPFVRLALARYQKNSVKKNQKDCCLSAIVQADYIQIPPPRASSIEFGATKNVISVAISGTVPKVPNAPDFRTKVQFLIEPIEVPSSEDTHISINTVPIDIYTYILTGTDINNFGFGHTHAFNLPAAYATRPYRVKVLEYEMITYDPMKPNPNPGGVNFGGPPMKDRLVFADVYEVNK
jgi:hypothetical protein